MNQVIQTHPDPPTTRYPHEQVRLQELKFQMAVRDQIIGEQRQVIANLWRILDKSGIGRERVLDIAKQVRERGQGAYVSRADA